MVNLMNGYAMISVSGTVGGERTDIMPPKRNWYEFI
jgi:hypothetical protein